MIERPVLLAEAVGTGILLAVIVGSGWAVERLGAAPASQLFIHAVVVGAGLGVAIAMFLPISGAQFNPVVTLALLVRRSIDSRAAVQIVLAQLVGGFGGLIVANLTFASEFMAVASIDRSGAGLVGGEVFATFGLVLVILLLVETGRQSTIPVAVGAWVTTIIVATVSTGFANPVVTVARAFTDSYTGIQPGSVAPFVIAQLLGAALAVGAASLFHPERKAVDV